jgi:hypothetical protein
MPREQYIIELAETVHKLFGNDVTDPSAREIAEAHFPDRALVGDIIESVRKRLHKVRAVLEEDYDQPVYLLSRTYYNRFRRNPPQNESDARRCIPTGYGKQTEGIRLQTNGDDDLIYQATLSHSFSAGAGLVRKQTNRVVHAVEDERLGEPRAGSMLYRAAKQAESENPALVNKLVRNQPKAIGAGKK